MENTLKIFDQSYLDGYLSEYNFCGHERATHSTITVGMGLNGVWCYGLNISWGTAGSSSGLSVYNKTFTSKALVFDEALSVLKLRMEEKFGDSDTGNYNHKIISATLKGIERYRVNQVQFSLF